MAFGGSARPATVRLAVLALAASWLLVAEPVRPARAAVTHTYLALNICGNMCFSGGGTIVDEVKASLAARSPYVVFLNEVCENQFQRLDAETSYNGVFDPTGPICRNGERYGNALLVRTTAFAKVGSWALPNTYGGEPRRLLCVRVRSGTPVPITACVTHISIVAGNKPLQVGRVAEITRQLLPTSAVAVGGDFNLAPTSTAMNPMYRPVHRPAGTGVYDEVDQGPYRSRYASSTSSDVYNEVTGGGAKIDYIFLSDEWRSFRADAVASSSDHEALWATVTYGWTLGDPPTGSSTAISPPSR